MLGVKPNASEGALPKYALSCVTQKKKSWIKGIVRWTYSTSACTTCPRDLCCNNEPSTAPPFIAFVCSKGFFLLHTQPDVSSEPLVLSRIILTSCHSSIHTLADSQTVHALQYIPEELIHRHSVSTRVPLSRFSRGNRTRCFLYNTPCSQIFSEESPPQHTTSKSAFSDSVSDTAGAALMLSPAKMTCIEVM